MKTVRVVGIALGIAAVLVLALTGCDMVTTGLKDVAVSGASMTLARVDQGWVEVAVSGSAGGTRIHWGDSYAEDSFTDVGGPGVYAHWFPREGRYAVTLLSGETEVAVVAVPVPVVSYHLELLSQTGPWIEVRYWGLQDAWHEINWGVMDNEVTTGPHTNDHNGTTVRTNGSTVGQTFQYRYYQSGTFEITMRAFGELPSEARAFATVVGINLIPYTLERTALASKKPGARVNIEVDMLAKHLERLAFFRGA